MEERGGANAKQCVSYGKTSTRYVPKPTFSLCPFFVFEKIGSEIPPIRGWGCAVYLLRLYVVKVLGAFEAVALLVIFPTEKFY